MKNSPATTQKPPHSGGNPPDFAPGPISRDTAQKHFERGVRPIVERNRWFLIALLLAAGHVGNTIAWNTFLPLKTVETYQVNKVEGGRLVADGTVVGNWVPDSDSIGYFINKWANSVFDINRATIEGTQRESLELAIGTAKAQLLELRRKDNPFALLTDNPQYSRSYEFASLNFIKEDVVLLRFRTISRASPEHQPVTVTYAMTVSFTRVKPTTRAEVMKNPAGLFITNINLTEEAVSK